jgi:hypothetical protein
MNLTALQAAYKASASKALQLRLGSKCGKILHKSDGNRISGLKKQTIRADKG